MSDMSEIGIRVSLVGGRIAAVEADNVARSVRGVGTATAETDAITKRAGSSTGGLNIMSNVFGGATLRAERAGGAIAMMGTRAERASIIGGGALAVLGERMAEVEIHSGSLYTSLVNVGRWMTVGGVVAAGALVVETARLGVAYEGTSAQVAANANVSVDAANKIGVAFLHTAGQTTFSASEIQRAYAGVAGQMGQVAGHALNASQATAFMNSSWTLAEAAGSDLNSTTADLASTMQSFNIPLAQSASASNLLYNTSRLTGSSIDSLTNTESRLHSRLLQTMPSLQDMSGLMLDLAEHGARGSRGTSVVSSALNTLLGGSKNVNDMLGALNVHLYDASGKFVGLQSVMDQLRPVLNRLPPDMQTLAEKTLFGSQSWQIMGAVVTDGTNTLEAANKKVGEQGVVHDAAEKKMSTLQGRFKTLKASATDWGTTVGIWVIPKLVDIGNWTMNAVGWMGRHHAAAIALAGVISTVLGGAMVAFVYDKGAKMIGTLSKIGDGLWTLSTRFFGINGAALEAAGAVGDEGVMAEEAVGTNDMLAGSKGALAAEYGAVAEKAPLAGAAIDAESAAAGGAGAGAGAAGGGGALATAGAVVAPLVIAAGAAEAVNLTAHPGAGGSVDTALLKQDPTRFWLQMGVDIKNWKKSEILGATGVPGRGSQKITGVMDAVAGSLVKLGDKAAASRVAVLEATVPSFQYGGTVPGPIGVPRLIIAHGGEEVAPVDAARAAVGSGSSPRVVQIMLDRRVLAEAVLDETRAETYRRT